jgi:hypothetical protein
MCTLTFSQTKNVKFDGVTVKVIKNVVIVYISSYKGKIEVNYRKVGDNEVYFLSEYSNMRGFSETHTLLKGKYIIEVIKDGVKTKKTFEVK